MKFGFRKPSIKRRIAARTSWKRIVRHSAKLKAPKGTGFITNPKKFAYNKIYRKTTVGGEQILSEQKRKTRSNQVGSSSTGNRTAYKKPILDGASSNGVKDYISNMAKEYEE